MASVEELVVVMVSKRVSRGEREEDLNVGWKKSAVAEISARQTYHVLSHALLAYVVLAGDSR